MDEQHYRARYRKKVFKTIPWMGQPGQGQARGRWMISSMCIILRLQSMVALFVLAIHIACWIGYQKRIRVGRSQ